jgi:hypothetical protein
MVQMLLTGFANSERLLPVQVRPPTDPVVIRQFEDWTDGCQRVIFVVNKSIRGRLHILRGDRINPRERLGIAHSSAVSEHLPSDVFGGLGK